MIKETTMIRAHAMGYAVAAVLTVALVNTPLTARSADQKAQPEAGALTKSDRAFMAWKYSKSLGFERG